MAEKIIIDTDPGVDDAMAIVYASLDSRIELMGLTTIFGNVTTDIATRNALVLLELIGEDKPVARGSGRPLVQEPKEVAWEVHGREGFGDVPPMSPKSNSVREPAHEFICQMANEYPGEITLCPIGPLTNIALALEHDPSIAEKVKGVSIMGGSLEGGGNVTPFAEANIWQDPHAADAVFAANWEVRMIGLDVTHKVICSPEDFASLPPKAPKLGGFLNECAQFYFQFHRKVDGLNGCHMHDPSAVISIVDPDFFTFDEIPLEVTIDGEELGRTRKSPSSERRPMKVALGVDDNAVKRRFLETIETGF